MYAKRYSIQIVPIVIRNIINTIGHVECFTTYSPINGHARGKPAEK